MNYFAATATWASDLATAHPTWAVVLGSALGAFTANLANKAQLRKMVRLSVAASIAPLIEALARDNRKFSERIAKLEEEVSHG